MKFFNVYESNGYGRNKMVVCSKSLVAHSEDPAVIDKRAAEFAKAHESNPKFLGLKLNAKGDEVKEYKKQSAKATITPTTPSTEV